MIKFVLLKIDMKQYCYLLLILLIFGMTSTAQLQAQTTHPKREVRAAWIATVSNVDYPSSSGLNVAAQKNEFIALLDTFKRAGINTIFVQIRPSCDAFYISPNEPWSQWLSGTQGIGPNPVYDPLDFYITEARKRGMEIHAWLNPYRSVVNIISSSIAYNHISVTQASWNVTYNTTKILNPGLDAVRQYVKNVILYIVNNYDIDGIHFDDYFYPYPQSGYTFNDAAAFAADPRGFTNLDDWRRDNVNLFIGMVYDSIKTAKKFVKFGVSPFGIWKSGTPAGITGLSSYYEIYCDPINWLQQKKTDYLIPQLYWAIGGSQDFNSLSNWWAQQAASNNRHCYAGIATYRMGNSNWPVSEIQNQINILRTNNQAQGYSFFSASQMKFNTKKINDSLSINQNKYKCLIPTMPWLDSISPNPPVSLTASAASNHVMLNWQRPSTASDGDSARYFVIYRFADYSAIDIQDASAIIGITASDTTAFTDSLSLQAGAGVVYVVTAADRLHNESAITTVWACYNCISASNDSCAQALQLYSTLTCNYTSGTLAGATSSSLSQPSCDMFSSAAMKDVFFFFLATDSTHSISVSPTGTGIEAVDAVIAVYAGTDCTNLTEIACTGASGGSGGQTKDLTLHNLIPGQKYWIRLYDYGIMDPLYLDFGICITHPLHAGTFDKETTSLRMYPNPAETYFMLDSPETVKRLRIISAGGNIVYQDCILEAQRIVILPNLIPGFYIVDLETEKGHIYEKLIIQ